MMTKKYRLIEIWCIFLNSFDLLKNRNANSVHGDIYTYVFFFFSDDLLDDSDSEEHSRSESVTGRLYLMHVICRGQEGGCYSKALKPCPKQRILYSWYWEEKKKKKDLERSANSCHSCRGKSTYRRKEKLLKELIEKKNK